MQIAQIASPLSSWKGAVEAEIPSHCKVWLTATGISSDGAFTCCQAELSLEGFLPLDEPSFLLGLSAFSQGGGLDCQAHLRARSLA